MTLLQIRISLIPRSIYKAIMLLVSLAAASSDLVDKCEPFVSAGSSCYDKHLFDFVDGNLLNLHPDGAVELLSPY